MPLITASLAAQEEPVRCRTRRASARRTFSTTDVDQAHTSSDRAELLERSAKSGRTMKLACYDEGMGKGGASPASSDMEIDTAFASRHSATLPKRRTTYYDPAWSEDIESVRRTRLPLTPTRRPLTHSGSPSPSPSLILFPPSRKRRRKASSGCSEAAAVRRPLTVHSPPMPWSDDGYDELRSQTGEITIEIEKSLAGIDYSIPSSDESSGAPSPTPRDRRL